LRVRNLYKSFWTKSQRIDVLKDIRLSIKKGEFIIIFGPSGSGKSTLLNTLIGLENPTSGSVYIDGADIYKLDVDKRTEIRKQKIGMIYQQSNWVRSLNVLENVALPLQLCGVPKQKALRVAWKTLAQIGISNKAVYFPSELSAGQQQKVGLARAIISDPDIIIADEPTGNLDHQSGQAVMDILTSFHKEGKTIIMVTHEIQYLQYAQRVLRIFDGRLVDDIKIDKDMSKKEVNELAMKDYPIEDASMNSDLSSTPDHYQDSKYEELSGNSLVYNFFRAITRSIRVMAGLFMYFGDKVIGKIGYKIDKKIILKINSTINKLLNKPVNTNNYDKLSEVDLIDLSVRNLRSREIRTSVTVGGIALAIGFIIFLLSIGYGIERLVVSSVAGLEERRQLDVMPAESVGLFLDDAKLNEFKKNIYVEDAYPVVNAVASLEYEGANLEIVTVGTRPEYLEVLDNKIIQGRSMQETKLELRAQEDATTEFEDVSIGMDSTISLIGKGEAVVTTALLKTLNKSEDSILSQEVSLVLNIPSKLTENSENIITDKIVYSITGVVEDDDNSLIYINIDDYKKMGVINYSVVHLSIASINEVQQVRSQINSMGYKTNSLLDITTRIQGLFVSIRQILLLIGLFAFAIASLGMFNTLTVSLLERTREVGLMKSMGMKSEEIFDLFMAESLAMSMLGGFVGILVGFIFGKISSVIVSLASLSNGIDYIEVSVIPFSLTVFIAVLSIIIGILTGFYPSFRATKISALNALRYE